MAGIKISDLYFVGLDLFRGSESFLHELNEEEIHMVIGGDAVVSQVTVTAGYLGIDPNNPVYLVSLVPDSNAGVLV
jgi:hypothetical protein